MRNFLLTTLSIITIFCISYFLPPFIGAHTDDRALWVLFFTGFYMGIAIVLLKITYFVKHYIKALLVIIACGVCHYAAVAITLRTQSYIFNYFNELQFNSDYSSLADPPQPEDYNVYSYSLANLVAISVLILCLNFILKFKKWYRLSICGASILMTLFMNLLINRLSQYTFDGDKGEIIPVLVFAIWQCVVGTVIYRGIKDDPATGNLIANPDNYADNHY